MHEHESQIDIHTLTIEEIREGVGGFSTDVGVITHPELKDILNRAGSEFEKDEPHKMYAVTPILDTFSAEFGYAGKGVTNKLNGPRGSNYFHFYSIQSKYRGSLLVGEQIEIEAAIAYLLTRRDILEQRGITQVKIADITSLARESLGNYYAAIPLLEPTSKTPAYVKKKIERKKIPLLEQYDEKETLEEEVGENEGNEKIHRYLIKIPTPTDEQLQIYSQVNREWIKRAIENIDHEIKRLQGYIFDEISYGRIGVTPDIARIVRFIYYADTRNLIDFDKSSTKHSYEELRSSLLKCDQYFETHKNIEELASLFLGVKNVVVADPESFFQKKKR